MTSIFNDLDHFDSMVSSRDQKRAKCFKSFKIGLKSNLYELCNKSSKNFHERV